jgi:Phage virion morphogenesis family
MIGNDAELERMESWIGGIMASLSPSARARAARNISGVLKGSNAKRIAAQRNPDGSAFDPRKKSSKPKPSNKTLKFLYPAGGTGEPRLVLLKSWVKQGPIFTGYDQEAEGIRSFENAKIVKHIPVTPEEQNKGARSLRQRPTIKSRLMFRKLRTYSLLKSGSNANEAWAGFSGRAARIGRVHQDGGFDRAGPKGKSVRYAKRQLLGLTAADEQQILDLLVGMVDAR